MTRIVSRFREYHHIIFQLLLSANMTFLLDFHSMAARWPATQKSVLSGQPTAPNVAGHWQETVWPAAALLTNLFKLKLVQLDIFTAEDVHLIICIYT